jgi:hypothetical protein
VGKSESNKDRDWPDELSAVHDDLQSELKDGGKEYASGARQRASLALSCSTIMRMLDYVCTAPPQKKMAHPHNFGT